MTYDEIYDMATMGGHYIGRTRKVTCDEWGRPLSKPRTERVPPARDFWADIMSYFKAEGLSEPEIAHVKDAMAGMCFDNSRDDRARALGVAHELAVLVNCLRRLR